MSVGKEYTNFMTCLKDQVNNEEQYIKPIDPNTAPRHMKYIPVWA